jgi:hypothetical protein
MPIQVIESRRLYLQIADQVRSLIAAGEFRLEVAFLPKEN